jgi:cysteine desulfurase
MRRIYLDHAATTPLDPRVREAMRPFFEETFGNPSSVHREGQQARAALEQSRATIARALGAEPGEVVFTSGGTESDNLAIGGVYRALRKQGRGHIVTAAAEHHAVLDCVEALRADGAGVTILPVDRGGRVAPEAVGAAVSERTCLVSVMHANNEVGTITDLASIAAVAHRAGALFHTDAVQSFGKVKVDVDALGVDLASVSAHKIYGPKGIGALYVRSGTALERLFHGGGQERGRRPGTENGAFAAGFARAAEISLEEMEKEGARLRAMRDALEASLRGQFPDILVNGDAGERLPNLLNVSLGFPPFAAAGETLVLSMDLEGIALSSGSACSSGSVQPSHVLRAMGRDQAVAKASLRFSFGRSSSEEDVGAVLASLRKIAGRLQTA